MTLNDYTFLTSSKNLDKTIQSIKEKVKFIQKDLLIIYKVNLFLFGVCVGA